MNKARTYNQWYNDYMQYRLSYSDKKPANDFVRCFLNWCGRTYPDETVLTQQMLDTWCAKRDTENGNSHGSRVSAINRFLDFVNKRGGGPYTPAEFAWSAPSPEPEMFTPEQLANFFKALDEIPDGSCYEKPLNQRLADLRAVQIPVAFRLLYSSGMRVCELRWLKRSDVDLNNGIIYIRKAKGYDERIRALHPTMTALLRQYAEKMDKLMPSANLFFPSVHDKYHNAYWLHTNFKAAWYKYNPKPTGGRRDIVAYSLRHNYAVENIMSWHQDGYNADKRVVALSKSMGHRSIKATQYYFHLVPRFADLLNQLEGESVSNILPKVETI